jgi:hypothetical protein
MDKTKLEQIFKTLCEKYSFYDAKFLMTEYAKKVIEQFNRDNHERFYENYIYHHKDIDLKFEEYRRDYIEGLRRRLKND